MNNISKYIFLTAMCLLFTFNSFAIPNPNLVSTTISPAPIAFPGGVATLSFRMNNDGSATSDSRVTVEVGLSNLDFAGSSFNAAMDIAQTAGSTVFTWSYNPTTKTLTGTLAGNFAQFASNDFEIRHLNVLAASAMSNPTVGCNINIVTPGALNSQLTDDNVSTYTYTTTTLPVGLLSFDATNAGDCASNVTWASETENNFDYYQLEQSTDSKLFVEVGNSQAKRGANAQYKQLVDLKSVKNNAVYFRLRIVDLDRTIHYSKIISLQSDCTKKNSLVIAPNPAKDVINIGGVNSNSNLFIFDMLGRLVLKTSLNDSNSPSINISNLTQGTYMIQVASGQDIYYHKLVKQ